MNEPIWFYSIFDLFEWRSQYYIRSIALPPKESRIIAIRSCNTIPVGVEYVLCESFFFVLKTRASYDMWVISFVGSKPRNLREIKWETARVRNVIGIKEFRLKWPFELISQRSERRNAVGVVFYRWSLLVCRSVERPTGTLSCGLNVFRVADTRETQYDFF